MSEIVLETINEQSKLHTLAVLREMLDEVPKCFTDISVDESFRIKNFIESFVHEL